MQRRAQRFFLAIPSMLNLLMGIFFCLILLILVVGQSVLKDYYQPYSLLPNLALYPFSLLGIVLLLRLAVREECQVKAEGFYLHCSSAQF